MRNVNTASYWDERFGSGNWELTGGYSQTRDFAESQMQYIDLGPEFAGTVCDFGCGARDAIPVYKRQFPRAKLMGVDFSAEAIRLCEMRYGAVAQFRCCSVSEVPPCDVIICSNVIEHIEDDIVMVEMLLSRCAKLFVTVPYREQPLASEHLRSYAEDSFASLCPSRWHIFLSKGWSRYGWDLWFSLCAKNVLRLLASRPLRWQQRQIIFDFEGSALGKGAQAVPT